MAIALRLQYWLVGDGSQSRCTFEIQIQTSAEGGLGSRTL